MQEIDDITIQQAKRKNRAAFKRVYDYYAPYAWKVAFRTMHGDQLAAQEAVQDTFIRVYNALAKFDNASAFSTWIFRITYNACMTLLSKQVRRNSMVTLDENTVQSPSNTEKIDMKELVQKILFSLSAEERFLLTGREILGFSYEELADITSKNAGLLRTQLFRLKEKIREKFGEE
jgi:RNA polymerase sigma-70 factor (ECF subfamily)